MPRYVALLRGVNVGGSGVLRMQDLRELCQGLGWTEVSTHLQSGNVRLTATGSAAQVRGKLEPALAGHVGKPVPVLLRTPAELRAAVARAPFAPRDPPHHCFVTFLERAPRSVPPDAPRGDLRFLGSWKREVYSMAVPVGGRAGNPNAPVEKHTGLRATTRNWNVVRALAED